MSLELYLHDLALLPGLSGHEQAVSAYMQSHFEELGMPVKVDPLGNTIATVQGSDPDAPSILITAHMDQLGFVVKTILPEGFIKLERVGGIPEKVLPALQVSVQTQDGRLIPGVIGVKSHHLTPAEEKYKVDLYTSLYVDIGCASKDEVLALGIRIGSPVIYRPHFEHLEGNRVSGTSFDNRAACAILLGLADALAKVQPTATVYLAGTVQEEYTIRGATLAARATRPKLCICLDITMEGGTPDLRGVNEVAMGGGPVLSLYNFHGRGTLNGTIPHPAMVRLLEQAATEANIPLQRVATIGGLTELAYMQLEGDGICGIDLDFPCRYTHSPVELCDLGDMEHTTLLLQAAITMLTADFSLQR